jgi:Ciliary basal body-associated, B9 protein
VSTWKPRGSWLDRLRTFFIGGSPELRDITYAKVPHGFSGATLSRFGFQAVTSGTLQVRWVDSPPPPPPACGTHLPTPLTSTHECTCTIALMKETLLYMKQGSLR